MDTIQSKQVYISQPNNTPSKNDICKSLIDYYQVCVIHNVSKCNRLVDLIKKYNCK